MYFDLAGNETVCSFDITVIDNIPPEIQDCPPPQAVEEPPGSGTWVIHATPDVGEWIAVDWDWPPTATDNCGVVSLEWTHEPGDLFQAGTTTPVVVTAHDRALNTATCTFYVIVEDTNNMFAEIELWPPDQVASPLTRCITFELWNCDTEEATEYEEELTFLNGRAVVNLLVPAGDYACATARDKLHTLRRTDENFHSAGNRWIADFTGNPFAGGDALILGNINDDYDSDEIKYIDILDYGFWNFQYSQQPDLFYETGDTLCGWTPPPTWPQDPPYRHADIDGRAEHFGSLHFYVTEEDLSFILPPHFLAADEPNCCGQPAILGNGPIESISNDDLRKYSLGPLTNADINGDGRLDIDDVTELVDRLRAEQQELAPID